MTQVILTSVDGSPWTVPGDWNDADNSIECIGAGGGSGGGSDETAVRSHRPWCSAAAEQWVPSKWASFGS